MDTPRAIVEQGLIALPGAPGGWIWAFACPIPGCRCRTALVLSAAGCDRTALLERGRPVAEAWLGNGHHAQAALEVRDVTAFALHLDTLELYPPRGDAPLDVDALPEVQAVIDRLDDDVLDAIARVWGRAKGEQPLPEPGAGGAKIAVENWRPGDLVAWDDARPSRHGDTYVFGERIFETIELYCVEPDCACGQVIVDFSPVVPRGAPHPGHVKFDGEQAVLHPEHERHRGQLTELWSAYCRRHRRHRNRFARRSATMQGLAGRFVAAPAKPKVGRNARCPCGSGKKSKKCCAAA